MSGRLGRPDPMAAIAALERRITALERRTGATASTDSDITFSHAGALVASTESPPAIIRRRSFLTVLTVGLGTAGSTATVLQVKADGVVIFTVTVPAGQTTYNADLRYWLNAQQRLSLRISTAGTGAADMTAHAWLA